MFFLNNIALAVETTTEVPLAGQATLGRTPLVTFGYLVQVFFSLLIVFGLIYLTARYLLPRFQISAKGRLIQVVDRVGLDPQVSAYIIKVGQSSYLVVVSSKGLAIEKLGEAL